MRNDNNDEVAVDTRWVYKTRNGYTVLEIKITNNTDNTHTAPEISIDLSNIDYNHNENIIVSEGFKRKSLDQNDMDMIVYDRITGTPCDEIEPHSEVTFQLGFKLQNTKNLTSPTQFWFTSKVLCNDEQQLIIQEDDGSNVALLDHEIESSGNNSDWFCECLGFGVPGHIPY